MASEEIILRSPALDNAVKMFAFDSYPSRRPGKNSLNQMGGMVSFGSSVVKYNGMHKLVLITDNSNPDSPTCKVCVCDGATYNPYTHTSYDSVVYVNGFIFNIKSQVFTISNNFNLVYIKFTAGSMAAAPKVEYIMTQRYIDNEDNTAYYLVGSVTQHETGICTVNQVHIGGNGNTAANMTYGVICEI